MKIEKLNNLFSVILKGVIIICLMSFTVIYFLKKDNGRFVLGGPAENTRVYVLDTKTGQAWIQGQLHINY
jgi:hypothetical protein